MFRYLVFSYERYERGGGMNDFDIDRKKLKDAITDLEETLKNAHYSSEMCGHIYDTKKRKIIWKNGNMITN